MQPARRSSRSAWTATAASPANMASAWRKRAYMPLMFSDAELAAMLDVRAIFNPDNVFNPGKVFPDITPVPERLTPLMPASDVFTPANAQEAAAGLAALSEARSSVRIGDGPLGNAEIRLSTGKMQGILAFAPDDLNVTVGAGTLLCDVQSFLAEHKLQTPLASPWPETTVGGLVASNINAPKRMRYGGLRDIMLCATVAMARGEVIRAGRPLVKNVAGYDLPKLFVGSHGTLGLLTDVTLKLIPLPRARRTLAIPVSTLTQGLTLAGHAMGHALIASAVVLVQNADVPGLAGADYTLLYTAEGLPEDVEAELAAVSNTLRAHGAQLIIETDRSGLDVWSGFLASTQDDQMLMRAGVPAKHLDRFLAEQPGNRPVRRWPATLHRLRQRTRLRQGTLHRRSERPGRCSCTAAACNRPWTDMLSFCPCRSHFRTQSSVGAMSRRLRRSCVN